MLITLQDVTDELVEKVEAAVGMGAGAWDCVDPKEIIAAAVNAVLTDLPPRSQPRTLQRALRLVIFALYDEKLHVPMAADPQNYIDQAHREIEREQQEHVDR